MINDHCPNTDRQERLWFGEGKDRWSKRYQKPLLDSGNEGCISKHIGAVNDEEDVDKDISNHRRGRNSVVYDTYGEEVTEQPSNKSTREVKFDRNMPNTASVGTTDSGAGSLPESET